MKRIWGIHRNVCSKRWAPCLHGGLHSLRSSASWRFFQRAEPLMLDLGPAQKVASRRAVVPPRLEPLMLRERPYMHTLAGSAFRGYLADGSVSLTACCRDITTEALSSTERLVHQEIRCALHSQPATGGDEGSSAGNTASNTASKGDFKRTETAEMPAVRSDAKRVSSDSGSSSNGSIEFAEVYLPRRSRLNSWKAADSGQSGGAHSEPRGPSVVESSLHEGAPWGPASTDKKPRPALRRRERPPLLSATDAAVAHIRELVKVYNEQLQQKEARGAAPQPRACGIRVSLQKQGCSGMAYDVAICTEQPPKGPDSSFKQAEGTKSTEMGDNEAGAPTGASKRVKNWREDEVVGVGGVEIRVAADAVMLLVGTQVDFVDEEVQTGFVFNNPNQRQSCGCGKSFMV